MSTLEQKLETALLNVYEKCRTIGYRPNYFKRMLTSANPRYYKGPVGTVRHLMLGITGPGSGFERLVKADRVDWTVEWLISKDPKWTPLFYGSEWVIRKAQARIDAAQNPN